MAIKNVGVVGCGLMGHGSRRSRRRLATTSSRRSRRRSSTVAGKIQKQLARAVEKGRMEQSQADEVIGRINPTLDYGDFADSVTFVIEDHRGPRGQARCGGARSIVTLDGSGIASS